MSNRGRGGGGGKKRKKSEEADRLQPQIDFAFKHPKTGPTPTKSDESDKIVLLPRPDPPQQRLKEVEQVITNSNNSVPSFPVGPKLPCVQPLPSPLLKPPVLLPTPLIKPSVTPSLPQTLPPLRSSPLVKPSASKEEKPEPPSKKSPEKSDLGATRRQLLLYTQTCDTAINKLWDSEVESDKQEKLRLLTKVKDYSETLDEEAINRAKHNDCNTQVATNTKRSAEEQPNVRLMLGRVKHDCVEEKLKAKPRRFTSVEQSFLKGELVDRFTEGSHRPDIVIHKDPLEHSSDVIAIFDLKFPCPSEKNKKAKWGSKNGVAQNDAYRRAFPGATLELIYPALKQ